MARSRASYAASMVNEALTSDVFRSSDDLRARVTSIFDGLARGDGSALVTAMHEDFSWTIAGVETAWSRTWAGRHVARSELLQPLMRSFRDTYTMRASRVLVDGDVAVVEAEGSGTTHDGRAYRQRYCLVCAFEGDALVSITEYADTAHMVAILGDPGRSPSAG